MAAGVTDRLWEVADIVKVREDWETHQWAFQRDRLASKAVPLLRKWLRIACQVAAAVLFLAALAWLFDPPLRSNLIEGSVIGWQRLHIPSPPSAGLHSTLLVKMDDGRTVGAASERRVQPSEGERVLVQERVGLLGLSKFYEMPKRSN